MGGIAEQTGAAEKIGARGMQKVIILEIAGCRQDIDERESGLGALDHGDGDGAIQGNDGRRLKAGEDIVEREDLAPIGIFGACGAAMQRGDRGLYGIGRGSALQRFFDQGQGFGDLCVIPARAILLFQRDQVAGVIEARVAAGIVKQHQS